MPFFQNVFNSDFTGVLAQADRNLVVNFSVPGNINNRHDMVCFNAQPYNLSTNKILSINFSFDTKNYATLAIDVSTTAVNASAALAREVVSALQANTTFATYYVATVTNQNAVRIQVLNQYKEHIIRTYLANTGAEIALKFNANAGVKEIPSYFSRHTIANVTSFPDSVGTLVQLNPAVPSDLSIIKIATGNPSWSSSLLQNDYQMLKGQSGLFTFQKMTLDGSNRITQIIAYPAGAVVGDFAKRTIYVYSGASTNPNQITEEPYTLTGADLIAP